MENYGRKIFMEGRGNNGEMSWNGKSNLHSFRIFADCYSLGKEAWFCLPHSLQ
jgi:hypothetical protein